MNFLVFRLYGPMASWGDIAVGGIRHSQTRPSKSAITGLLGSALGIRRELDDQHEQLVDGYKQATKILKMGQVLKDYHTVQAPDSVGKFRYRTRRDELVHGKDRLGNALLSSREYRVDSHFVVALKALDSAPYSLEELQQALCTPKFNLYLGRKSCPLAAPLGAQIVSAENFLNAFESYSLEDLLTSKYEWGTDSRWLPQDDLTHYYWEGQVNDFSEENQIFRREKVQELSVYDRLLSRSRWQFAPRTEYLWLHKKEIQ